METKLLFYQFALCVFFVTFLIKLSQHKKKVLSFYESRSDNDLNKLNLGLAIVQIFFGALTVGAFISLIRFIYEE